MPSTLIEKVLSGTISVEDVINWLSDDSNNKTTDESTLFSCSKSEFAAYFLSYLRSQTDKILQTNVNALQVLQHQNTPQKLLNSQRKHRRSISEPNSSYQDGKPTDSLDQSNKSSNKDKTLQKKQGRRVKTKLFKETDQLQKSSSTKHSLNVSTSSTKTDSDESKLSSGVSSIFTSTPVKNGINSPDIHGLPMSSPVSPNNLYIHRSVSRHSSFNHLPDELHERCDTPRLSHRNKISRHEKSSNSLGDYIKTIQPCKSHKKKKSSSKTHSSESIAQLSKDQEVNKTDGLTAISKRHSTSLCTKKERARIEPITLSTSCTRSTSLNSFNTENIAFRQAKELTIEIKPEHSPLKQEGLIDKFNVLSITSLPNLPSTPEIKLNENSLKQENCIHADVNKITFKDKVDILVVIYDGILKNNLVLNISSEIYFLISILLSKQYKDDYLSIEAKIDNNFRLYLLRSIHNCSYFAVKTLWLQRSVLELMFDKTSLKLLGENKQVRSFYPELAKFLLNLYGLKCEAESITKNDKGDNFMGNKYTNDIITFNIETDGAENFPSVLSCNNFKKQRDLFYELLRWWSEQENSNINYSLFRSRVKALLSLAVAPENHEHLARLIRDHILAECHKDTQESKMCKLQKRLMGTSAFCWSSVVDSSKLPNFNDREKFYRDLIILAENESFRVHFRDALTHEVMHLDASITLSDLRNNASTSTDISAGYFHFIKKMCLLSKFLGYVNSLPYTQVPVDYALKIGVPFEEKILHSTPGEKIMENHLNIRNYTIPPINLTDILLSALTKHRLCITLPWMVHYLAMVDYVMIRTIYYNNLLKLLFGIYQRVLKNDQTDSGNDNTYMKRNTIIFLKLCLGWLFEMPHFPQEVYYEPTYPDMERNLVDESGTDTSLDYFNLIDENVLFEICGYLKELNVLLFTTRSFVDQELGGFKNMAPAPTKTVYNKEMLVQSRIEEELMKSQTSSTRRVIDMVIDRVISTTIKELAVVLNESISRVTTDVVLAKRNCDHSTLPFTLDTIYHNELRALKALAMEKARASIDTRASMALKGLLPGNGAIKSLEAIAKRSSLVRISKWIEANWNDINIFCKNIEKVLRDTSTPKLIQSLPTSSDQEQVFASPYIAVPKLKEYIITLFRYEASNMDELLSALEEAKLCCMSNNAFVDAAATALIHQLTCELVITCISRKPDFVTAAFFQKTKSLWDITCPDRENVNVNREPSIEERDFTADDRCPTPVSDDEIIPTTTTAVKCEQKSTQELDKSVVNDNPLLEVFERTLCPRNIKLLSTSVHPQPLVWNKMAEYIVFLLKNNYLSEDSLTEQCLAVYRQNWPQNIQEHLSLCMRLVSSQWGRSSEGKLTLFLDFLAEYCNDLDYEQDVSIMS